MKLLNHSFSKGFNISAWHISRIRLRVAGLLAGFCFGLASAGAAVVPASEQVKEELAGLNVPALCRAVEDLRRRIPASTPRARRCCSNCGRLRRTCLRWRKGLRTATRTRWHRFSKLVALRQKALLSNPLLDFEQVLLVKRREDNLALPQNWQGNSSLNPHVENEICLMPVQEPGPAAEDVLQARKGLLRGRCGPEFRRGQAAVLLDRHPQPLAGVRDSDGRHRAAAGDAGR